MKNIVAILDFGSAKITLLVGKREVNDSIKLFASAEADYDGYSNGEFRSTGELKSTITNLVNDVQGQLECKLTDVFVGVPAEFCFAFDKTILKNYNKPTKIIAKMVDNLFLVDNEENPYLTHTVINKASLFYVINDDNKTNNPVGKIATKLQSRVSYILVENNFKTMIGGILDSIGIKNYDYISSTMAEAIYLIDENKRNEGAILVDCGYLSTSVCQVLGDGLKELKSFSMGGAHITADIAKAMELTFEEAEEIKRQAIVTLNPYSVEYYETSTHKKCGVKAVNEIILTRVDKIWGVINKCLESFSLKLPNYLPICLTGGGITFIEGLKDYFRKNIEREITIVKPKLLLYARPDLSSAISVLDMALNLYK